MSIRLDPRAGLRHIHPGAALAAACVGFSPAFAQQDEPTHVPIDANIYHPAQLSPTVERIQSLSLPEGFRIERFAEGLDNPRMLALAEDGTIYVTQRTPGNLVMLRDTDGDGIADVQRIVLRLRQIHGIAIHGNEIYVTDATRIYVGQLQADGTVRGVRTHVRGLPDGGQHPNRTIDFSPQGELFVSVGSSCNACPESNEEHATLIRLAPGEPQQLRPRRAYDRLSPPTREIYASGLRNTIGFGWHPGSGRLYGMDNGIDWLGDDDQGEELNEIEQGRLYGWPYVYDDNQVNPIQGEPEYLSIEEWANRSTVPVGLYTPHSSPMQMVFYQGAMFPQEYQGDAIYSMRGSWNRNPPSGYEVLRVRFNAGGEFQGFEPFIDGFLVDRGDGGFGYFGRPVGMTQLADGSLLFTDDTNNMIYRVSYGDAQQGEASPQALAGEILEASTAQPITVESAAFEDGGSIPLRYSDYGRGVSPPLSWSQVPEGTVSMVLMMEDPDAVSPLPFVHWTMVNIPANVQQLSEGIRPHIHPLRNRSVMQGSNSKSATGYFGPRPPADDPPHSYHFQVFALDTQLDLPAGFNRHTLLQAMEGHVLAKGELIGTFQAPDEEQ